MGILQENRINVPQPDVKDTGYGVQYVNVQSAKVKEESVVSDVAVGGAVVADEAVIAAPVVDDVVADVPSVDEGTEDAVVARPQRKRGGRARKSKKGA